MADGTLTSSGTQEFSVNGAFTVHLSGDFGGGQVQLQFVDSDKQWRTINPTDYTFTAPIDIAVRWKENALFRLNFTGATTPNLFWKIGG